MDDDARTTTTAQRVRLGVLTVLGVAAVAWAALVGGPADRERVEVHNAIAGHWGHEGADEVENRLGRHWIEFGADGAVRGHDGCNIWRSDPADGPWRVEEDGIVTWAVGLHTTVGCDGQMTIPSAAKLDGDELVLLDGNRQEIARFTRTGSTA